MILPLFFFSLVGMPPAFADWEAKYVATSSKGSFPKIDGKIYAEPDRVRVDSPYPFEMSLFAKTGSNQADAAIHSFRIRLQSNTAPFIGQVPACLGKSFDACIANLKLKKVSSEKCGEFACDVYEGAPKLKGIKKVKVWHRSGEKEAILARTVVTKTNADVITVDFSEVTKTDRPEAFFTVPANYKNAGSLERFVGDLGGKSET